MDNRFGYIKDERDPRDYQFYQYSKELRANRYALPRKVSYRDSQTPVKNQGSMGCHDDKTEVLSENGWKLFKDLEDSERVATVNPNTHEIEYQVPATYFEYDYSGQMYHFNHKNGLNALVTPNHRMYVRPFVESERTLGDEFKFVNAENIGWYSGLLVSLGWQGESPEYIRMPDVEIGTRLNASTPSIREGKEIPTSDFVEFLGLYLAEGCCYNDGTGSYRVEISASEKNSKRDDVLAIVNKLPYNNTVYKDRVTICNKSLFEFLQPLGDVHSKRVPGFVMKLKKSDIEKFLRGYYLGDGHTSTKGVRSGYSVSSGLLDDIQELSLKVGIFSRKKHRDRSEHISYINGRPIQGSENAYELHESQTNRKMSIETRKDLDIIDYNGKVYCVEVPNQILITRREGCILISGNSCVSFAGTALKEWQEQKEADDKRYDLSEQWLYWNCKSIDNVDSQGTYIRIGMKVLNHQGIPPEHAWPYNDDYNNPGEPESWSYMVAKWGMISEYRRVTNVRELKECLASNGPVIIGMAVFRSIYDVDSSGIVPMPGTGRTGDGFVDDTSILMVSNPVPIGGHAVLGIGYDDDKQLVEFKNSWTDNWGDKGFGYLYYDYIDKYAMDMWTVVDKDVKVADLKGKIEQHV